MMLIDPFRFRGSGPVECEYLGVIDPDGAWTIPDVPLGDPAPGRLIVCSAHWFSGQGGGNVQILSATIGGVPAAINGQGSTNSGEAVTDECGAAFFSATVPTGTSATVDVVFNLSPVALVYLATWRAINVISETPYDTEVAFGPSSLLDTTCDVKKDGVAFLAGMSIADGDPPVTVTGVNQDYGLSYRGAGGSLETSADEIARPMSTEFGSALAGDNIHVNVAVSFR